MRAVCGCMTTRTPVQPLPSVEPAFDLADLLDESLPSVFPAFESAAFDGFPDDFDDFVISPPPSSGGSPARASDTRVLRRALALTATRVGFLERFDVPEVRWPTRDIHSHDRRRTHEPARGRSNPGLHR